MCPFLDIVRQSFCIETPNYEINWGIKEVFKHSFVMITKVCLYNASQNLRFYDSLGPLLEKPVPFFFISQEKTSISLPFLLHMYKQNFNSKKMLTKTLENSDPIVVSKRALKNGATGEKKNPQCIVSNYTKCVLNVLAIASSKDGVEHFKDKDSLLNFRPWSTYPVYFTLISLIVSEFISA